MNEKIEELEHQIRMLSLYIEENARIDRVTKEKLTEKVVSLFDTTGEMKEQHEKTWNNIYTALNEI